MISKYEKRLSVTQSIEFELTTEELWNLIMNILIKFEDVRKDKLTMVVAEYLKKICMDERAIGS